MICLDNILFTESQPYRAFDILGTVSAFTVVLIVDAVSLSSRAAVPGLEELGYDDADCAGASKPIYPPRRKATCRQPPMLDVDSLSTYLYAPALVTQAESTCRRSASAGTVGWVFGGLTHHLNVGALEMHQALGSSLMLQAGTSREWRNAGAGGQQASGCGD